MPGRRRGNQEGSITQRDNGTWRVQLTLEGKRLSYSAKTRLECQEWLKKITNQIDSGLSYSGASMKLGDYLAMWLKGVKENKRPKTYIQYQQIIDKYILPKFANIKLRDLQPIRIENFLNAQREGGVGDRTSQIIFSIFHVALANAVKKGIIGRNPLDAVEKPKVKNPKKKITLDPQQIQQLLITAEQFRNGVIYHIAIASGMREGELLGLKWRDIDFVKSRLKVERQVQRLPKQGLVFSPPKTEAGNRYIALGSFTKQKLIEHQKNLLVEKRFAGDRWKENDLVFPSSIGTPVDPRNLISQFKKLLKLAGLPDMRFHDLRHTSITLMLNEIGAPIKEVQKRAGHTRPSTTLNIYGGEATSKLDEVVAQGLDELITPIQIELHQNCTKKESLLNE